MWLGPMCYILNASRALVYNLEKLHLYCIVRTSISVSRSPRPRKSNLTLACETLAIMLRLGIVALISSLLLTGVLSQEEASASDALSVYPPCAVSWLESVRRELWFD